MKVLLFTTFRSLEFLDNFNLSVQVVQIQVVHTCRRRQKMPVLRRTTFVQELAVELQRRGYVPAGSLPGICEWRRAAGGITEAVRFVARTVVRGKCFSGQL